jgi:DNA-3-methyladenine glycosylase II
MQCHPIATVSELAHARAYLASVASVLSAVIKNAPEPTLKPHTNYYDALIASIISQQLSVKAADTIEKRFRALFAGSKTPSPELVANEPIENLRNVGLSNAKAGYIQDLAQHIIDGRLQFDTFDTDSNEEIIKKLVAVKGIGEWTAHMFLMFCMGRLDVLAPGDLGIQNGIKKIYGLDYKPTPKQVVDHAGANKWHPYETLACWYIWHAYDAVPEAISS